MDQQQWLEWRKQGIGASDAPVVMGFYRFKTINQLLKEKLGLWKQEDNAAMARGRELEDPALGSFMMETGIFMDTQVRKVHKDHDWMRATLDGWNEKDRLAVEIKTSTKGLHDEIPDYYYPQLQHQMEVLGIDSMFYYSYDGIRGKTLKIDKNPGYIETLLEKEARFWERVQKGMLDLEEDENFNHHLERYLAIREAEKQLKEEESFHLSQMILFSDGCPAQGKLGSLFQKERKGSVDYKEMVSEYNKKINDLSLEFPEIFKLLQLDLDSYRKPSTSYWQVETRKLI